MGYFLPFYPSNSLKNQNFKKMRQTHRDIIILHKCTKIHDHMLNCSWDMVRHICNYFSFWAIFCPFTPLTAQKSKFQKNEKKSWRYHHFTHVYQKLWLDDVQFLRYGVQRTGREMGGQTVRRKKWHIEVGAPLKIKLSKVCIQFPEWES